MNKTKGYKLFRNGLLRWHKSVHREMPWKNTRDPYKIWISEIILQQTRVAQGIRYYHRFIEKFPSVQDLAEASEDEVLSVWKGLGYYARARNMHYAAQHIVKVYDGKFPASYAQILSLKGVGTYTAAAIGSFAFDLPYAVLDGNVFRVLSRYFGIEIPIDNAAGKKIYGDLAQSALDISDPAEYNQAIMDFGALQCTAQAPDCHGCPLQEHCIARVRGLVSSLPVRSKRIKVRKRHFHFLIYEDEEKIFMTKRKEKDIWKGLYQPPLLESTEELSMTAFKERLKQEYNTMSFDQKDVKKLSDSTQRLTHQLIYGCFYQIKGTLPFSSGEWKSKEELKELGLPKIVNDFLNQFL